MAIMNKKIVPPKNKQNQKNLLLHKQISIMLKKSPIIVIND